MNHCGRIQNFSSRRALLQKAGGGIGMLALNSLLNQTSFGIENNPTNPLASKQPHYEAKAKNVIWLFINGFIDTSPTDLQANFVPLAGGTISGFASKQALFHPLLNLNFQCSIFHVCYF